MKGVWSACGVVGRRGRGIGQESKAMLGVKNFGVKRSSNRQTSERARVVSRGTVIGKWKIGNRKTEQTDKQKAKQQSTSNRAS